VVGATVGGNVTGTGLGFGEGADVKGVVVVVVVVSVVVVVVVVVVWSASFTVEGQLSKQPLRVSSLTSENDEYKQNVQHCSKRKVHVGKQISLPRSSRNDVVQRPWQPIVFGQT
jgi:hypothetical protein